MSKNSLESLHEGWLTKSPPTRRIWRARWRKRWFALRHSGELPGQYFLEYYTDHNCRKLKGKIDLDLCEQVDAGLRFENRKQKYQHMFDIKTPRRTYFLAAESEEEMNKWVESICRVCGLKAYAQDEDDYMRPREAVTGPEANQVTGAVASNLGRISESPPLSPSVSGPYIPISECISGRPLTSNGLFGSGVLQGFSSMHNIPSDVRLTLRNLNSPVADLSSLMGQMSLPHPPQKQYSEFVDVVREFYDKPRKLQIPDFEECSDASPLHSPTTDVESVFTDDESLSHLPSVNWNTFPREAASDGDSHCVGRPSDSSEVGSFSEIEGLTIAKKFGKINVTDSTGSNSAHSEQKKCTLESSKLIPSNAGGNCPVVAPPRPPKPLHLIEMPSHNYSNVDMSQIPNPNVGMAKDQSNAEGVLQIPNSPSGSISESRQIPECGRPTNASESLSDCDSFPYSPKDGYSSSTLSKTQAPCIVDEMYDFPRSHQQGSTDLKSGRHCYTNAAPTQVNGVIFRYDFQVPLPADIPDITSGEPNSPKSETSSVSSPTVMYSNLPSPFRVATQEGKDGGSDVSVPPLVNRDLKPGRKESNSSEPSPGPLSGMQVSPLPPTVDRTLKPQRKFEESLQLEESTFKLASPPCRVHSDSRNVRTTRAAPSPTAPPAGEHSDHFSSDEEGSMNLRNSPDEQIYYFLRGSQILPQPPKKFEELQYLDLDLDSDASAQSPKSPERVQSTATVYKTVDFVKTEAFNRTKKKVEEDRKKDERSTES